MNRVHPFKSRGNEGVNHSLEQWIFRVGEGRVHQRGTLLSENSPSESPQKIRRGSIPPEGVNFPGQGGFLGAGGIKGEGES